MKSKIIMSIMAVLMIAEIGQSVSFSLSSPGHTGNAITVALGELFTVDILMDAPENGNTFEVFLGFDVSSQTVQGLGGLPTLNKLTLMSTTIQVSNSIDADFTVYRSAKIATAREVANSALGGRPYGLKIVGARNANTAGGSKTLCSVTFQNNLPAGQSYAIVLSDATTGHSYTSAWKNGITSNRSGYTLTVVSGAYLQPGDANGDNKVDVSDLGIFAANYGTTSGATWAKGDFNNDGKVDVSDLGIFAACYGVGTGRSLDFNKDAKALGLPVGDEETAAKDQWPLPSALGCGSEGLPLVAGLFWIIGLVSVKSEE